MSKDVKIVFVINKRILNGKLTKFFTGCYCYHVGILVDNLFYDVAPFKGRRVAEYNPEHYEDDQHIIFDAPVYIPEWKLKINLNDKVSYGYIDYVLFLFKPLTRIFPSFKLFNGKGLICSEQVNNDLIGAGWKSPFPRNEHPPSPCTLLDYFLNHYTPK